MLLAQDGTALGAGEHFVCADDAMAQMPAAGAEAQAAAAALGIGAHLAVAIVGHEHGLIGRGATVRFLEDSAPLAGAITAKRAVGEHRLSGPEVLAAAAPGAGKLQPSTASQTKNSVGFGGLHSIQSG